MRQQWTAAGLLWLVGVALRITILATPPVIAMIQADLGLNGTQVGILSALPVLMFSTAALLGSLLIARFGAIATLVVGLLIAGVGSALRGAMRDVFMLYATTALMSAGVAVVHPALPPLVQRWFPKREGFASAIYTNGLLVGETLPVMLTIPLLLPLIDGSWRLSFVVWGLPPLAVALVALVLAPRLGAGADAVEKPVGPVRWWPDWRSKPVWQFGLVFASVNSIYFACNSFLPGHLTAAGRADLISAALTALNFGQLPASFLLLATVQWLERRAWPFMVCGVLELVCIAGMAFTADASTVLFAGVLGFLGAVVFTLGFALPALLGSREDVARISAAMFTISYCAAVVVSVASGAAWDLGGSPRFAFLPMAFAALMMIAVPPTIRFQDTRKGDTRGAGTV